jgi:hypothetical protein
MQTGKIIPFKKKNIILFHLHQYVSRSHVAVAWDCPSVLFSKASMAFTILFPVMTEHLLLLHVPVGNVVVIPVTQCMDEKQIKQKSVSVYSRV